MLRLVGVGALGNMLSPAARHLSDDNCPGSFIRIYDRNPLNVNRQQRREQWIKQGATLVTTSEDLIKKKDFDGIFICAGKNGDDIPLIKKFIRLINQYFPSGKKPFIVHLSTVSVEFVEAAYKACQSNGVDYVNYPLTGGAKGALNATMLILASGNRDLYERLAPVLSKLGQPRYFGKEVSVGAKVKLISHVLVFNGLLGICTALALQTKSIPLDPLSQTALFDFMNQGAGGTRQWDVALRQAVSDQIWDAGFLLPHAAIDAIYTADLLIKNKIPAITIFPILYIASVFSFLLQQEENKTKATQSLLKWILNPSCALEKFIASSQHVDPSIFMKNVINSFPQTIRQKIHLEVCQEDFLEYSL
jgi:3-hydroxyisobutyrate dehydrogenase-like beta-hydroxyacid dehydrogenase